MPTADDDLEDEDLSQYAKSWRQSNSGNAQSSGQHATNNERSSNRVMFQNIKLIYINRNKI